MELDELKNIWQKQADFRPKGVEEIASMLRGSSTSLVDKLKKSVWFELLFTILAGIGLIVYALLLPNGALKWTSISFLVLFVLYSVYYVKKILLLRQFSPDDNLRGNLEKLVSNLTSYLRFYKRSYTILYPVYFCLGLLFAAIDTGSDRFFETLASPKTIVLLAILAGLVFFICTGFANWYLKKLYGNHLQKLNLLLKDLTEAG